MNLTSNDIERFWSKVHMIPCGGCWLWTDVPNGGYGVFCFRYEKKKAHTVSLELEKGPPPPGKPQANHDCDNPICVNPSHLYWGSQADNIRDRDERARRTAPSGELHGKAKLSADQVMAIRSLYANGGITQRALSVKFGVNEPQIWKIVNNKAWNHL